MMPERKGTLSGEEFLSGRVGMGFYAQVEEGWLRSDSYLLTAFVQCFLWCLI